MRREHGEGNSSSRKRVIVVGMGPVKAATASMSTQDEVIDAYEQGRTDVYHYMLRLGLDPARAQEVSQEVFLRLFVALPRGEEIRNKRAWVFRVAHNLGIDARRE